MGAFPKEGANYFVVVGVKRPLVGLSSEGPLFTKYKLSSKYT